MLGKLDKLDSRLIYLLLALAISVPLLQPIGLPLAISKETKQVYDRIEALPEGARVMLSYDYSAGGVPELDAGVRAILRHLAEKNAKVVAVASTTEGPMYASNTLSIYESMGKRYGDDYVNLGYFAGGESGLSTLCRNINQVYTKDFKGTPISNYKIMDGVNSIRDFDLVISFNIGPSDGATTPAWVRLVKTEYNVPLILYVVTVMAPANMPYLQSKQIDGLMSGLRAGAEYEKLVNVPGSAVAAMDAQSISHLVIIFFILLGNVALFVQKKVAVAGQTGDQGGAVK